MISIHLDLEEWNDKALALQLTRAWMMQKLTAAVGIMIIALLVWAPLFAQSASYFQGKTILLIQGREPGGDSVSQKIPAGRADHRHPVYAGRRRPKGDELRLSQRQVRWSHAR